MSMSYWVALQYAELPSLSDRHDKLCRNFFCKLLNPSNCIHHLLPLLVTLKSRLSLEKQPLILDLVTVLTATNLSFITPS